MTVRPVLPPTNSHHPSGQAPLDRDGAASTMDEADSPIKFGEQWFSTALRSIGDAVIATDLEAAWSS